MRITWNTIAGSQRIYGLPNKIEYELEYVRFSFLSNFAVKVSYQNTIVSKVAVI